MTIMAQRTIKAGTLTLSLHQNGDRLDELLAFGSRLNPRRGYLFISRVLGKHMPVRPSKMDAIHEELASGITLLGASAYVVGMAETAVGLGAGVARHLSGRYEYSVFHHTTRFQVSDPWLHIREDHSHADTMHMAHLTTSAQDAIKDIQDLVLVDDEISTGKTLAQLASKLISQSALYRVKRLHIVSLVSWLTEAAREELLQQLPQNIDVRFVQLMAGHFHFAPRAGYQPQLPVSVDTDFCNILLRPRDTTLPIESEGLYGKIMTSSKEPPLQGDVLATHEHQEATVVFGMGEYLDAPFRLALYLERQGHDVMFQSSTRSPIAISDAVKSRIEHEAPGSTGKRHFLYNAPENYLALAFNGIGCPALASQLEENHLRNCALEVTE